MESRTMRHLTKEEQKKYTESISKVYKPTGGNIMDYTITTSDDLELERLMTEVIKSNMKDEMKVKVIKRLCNQKATYIPYYDGNERKPWEPIAIYATSPTTSEPCANLGYAYIGDSVESQPHTVCESCNIPKTPMSAATNKVCGNCKGRGVVHIGNYITGNGTEKCKVCDGKGYVENSEGNRE